MSLTSPLAGAKHTYVRLAIIIHCKMFSNHGSCFALYWLFSHHTLQMKLADMEVKLQSARLLTWKAAMLKDAGENFIKVLCMCTVYLCYHMKIFWIRTEPFLKWSLYSFFIAWLRLLAHKIIFNELLCFFNHTFSFDRRPQWQNLQHLKLQHTFHIRYFHVFCYFSGRLIQTFTIKLLVT